MDSGPDAALTQLRALLANTDLSVDPRLPPERKLVEMLGLTRPALRRALAVLEAEGQIWRHVGKGTFVGSRPANGFADVGAIAQKTNPGEVMRTRILIEPEVAAMAALTATPLHIAEMWLCIQRSRNAGTWRHYEAWDNRFHRVIGEAAQNHLLLALLDTLNAVRRTVTWGRLRAIRERPAADHHSFADHAAIVAAIEDRDRARARERMRTHLLNVERNLLDS